MVPVPLLARSWAHRFKARWPDVAARLRGRAGAVALTVAIELLLLLALLSLGAVGDGDGEPLGETVATFDVSAPEAPAPEPSQPREAAASPAEVAPAPQVPSPLTPSVPPPVLIPRATVPAPVVPPAAPEAAATAAPSKIRAVIRSDMGSARGPADTGARDGDSQRIAGSGPNGEPLYAAKWYREPTDDEFRGYFSRVQESGWALINCRTEPAFRVDDCVLVGEGPERSGVGSAVLAMAWQFRVRPPRVGGRSMVGEWVRIRIDYTITRL